MVVSPQCWSSILISVVAAWILPAGPAGSSQDLVFDRIAAIVNDDVVTLTDIEWLIRYRGYKVPEDPEQERTFYQEILDQIINQLLIKRETSRTPFIAVTEEEITGFLSVYRQRLPGGAFAERLESMDMQESDLRELIRRQLAVNKFIELRFEPFIIVMPAEIDRYYQNEYAPLLQESGQSLPPMHLVEETIRQILTVRKSTEYLERWIRDARQSSEITVLLGHSPDRAPNLPKELLHSGSKSIRIP